ncbi:NAD-dependent epimerase/dehydratase family protein [Kaistia adipata]|uniref:NAD-dependent epimerase/dehydratase family protein n=1 Tax=Kaistia adipata TaxID=166954 RepID=UPI0004293F69|nr:NAD(P)-dependent oxidoreductase [Kaistia adipata]
MSKETQDGLPLVLVTGAAGLLGRYIVRELVANGYCVRGFDRRQGEDEAEWHVGDVTNADDVAKAVDGVDLVIHAAARANIWQGTGEEILTTNVLGTWNVFEAARKNGVPRVVFCSSDSVIGYTVREGAMAPPRYMPVDLAHPLQATDPYALSKVMGEDIARAAVHWGLQTVAIRTVFVAYPEMYGEIRARHADPANYKGTPAGGPSSAGGGAFYNYIDPRDLARAFRLALELEMAPASFETFFVASPDTLAAEPTVERARRLHGTAIEVRDAELYAGSPYASLYDTRHAAQRLGFRPEHSLRHLISGDA